MHSEIVGELAIAVVLRHFAEQAAPLATAQFEQGSGAALAEAAVRQAAAGNSRGAEQVAVGIVGGDHPRLPVGPERAFQHLLLVGRLARKIPRALAVHLGLFRLQLRQALGDMPCHQRRVARAQPQVRVAQRRSFVFVLPRVQQLQPAPGGQVLHLLRQRRLQFRPHPQHQLRAFQVRAVRHSGRVVVWIASLDQHLYRHLRPGDLARNQRQRANAHHQLFRFLPPLSATGTYYNQQRNSAKVSQGNHRSHGAAEKKRYNHTRLAPAKFFWRYPLDHSEPLIRAEHLSLQIDGRQLLQDISLELRQGEIVTVIGPNGAGKTTLLRLLLGLTRPTGGSVWRRPGLRLGYMPQRLHIDASMPMSVLRFLQLGGAAADARAALAEVGAARLANARLADLSGGEMQRVLLARACARKPQLLVLDEPTQGVDVGGQTEVYQLIAALRDQLHCGVLLVSHDLHLVMAATDKVLCINQHLCCEGHPEQVSRDPAYLELFGDKLALYTHEHDHAHNLHGDVVTPAHRHAHPKDRGEQQ